MKNSLVVAVLVLVFSCGNKSENSSVNNKPENAEQVPDLHQINSDSLFQLEIDLNQNAVKITAPKNSRFELPDSTIKIEPYKTGDFNADHKEDVLVNLGACGTGGCVYALFLNQYNQYYKLAFSDYL